MFTRRLDVMSGLQNDHKLTQTPQTYHNQHENLKPRVENQHLLMLKDIDTAEKD